MFYVFAFLGFLGFLGLLFFQDYYQFGDWWSPVYFIVILIIFFIKQHLENPTK